MDQICAVVDVQGFQFSDRFVGREIAIVSEHISQCQELNPQFNWRDLSEADQSIVIHSTHKIHGLHYCPFNPRDHSFLYHSKDIGKIIMAWYQLIATDSRPLFAYKNQQMGSILKELDIPCLDLDSPSIGFPSFRDLQNKYGDNYLCAYHKKPHPKSTVRLICAYRKANHLYRELFEQKDEKMDWNNM